MGVALLGCSTEEMFAQLAEAFPILAAPICTCSLRLPHPSLLHAPTILPCSKAMLNFPLATYAADFSEAELDAIDARVAAGKPTPLTGTAGGQGQGPCGGCGAYDEHLFRHLE